MRYNLKFIYICLIVFIYTIHCFPSEIKSSNFTSGVLNLNNSFQSTKLVSKKVNLNYASENSQYRILTAQFNPLIATGNIQIIDEITYQQSQITSPNNQEVAIIGKPLFYPNPTSLTNGSELGYALNKDADVRIELYDMMAHRIFRKDFSAGALGARAGYNRLFINLDTFYGFELSSGVYFCFIISNGKLLGKAKLAVIP